MTESYSFFSPQLSLKRIWLLATIPWEVNMIRILSCVSYDKDARKDCRRMQGHYSRDVSSTTLYAVELLSKYTVYE